MKTTVDKSLCFGCGICVDVCPDVFEMNDDNTAQARPGSVPADAVDACRDAASQCPQAAIQIEVDDHS